MKNVTQAMVGLLYIGMSVRNSRAASDRRQWYHHVDHLAAALTDLSVLTMERMTA